MSDDTTAQYLACGVCLLSVDMKMKGGGQENGNSVAKLTYGGRQYHSACANLWINCVDSTLPALKLPELLWLVLILLFIYLLYVGLENSSKIFVTSC